MSLVLSVSLLHMSSKKLIAANWKMNAAPAGFESAQAFRSTDSADVVVFPSFLDIEKVLNAGIIAGGQSSRPEEKGAFTGDVSIHALKNAGCTYVLCGHSERRQHHKESDEDIGKQVEAAKVAGLTPILCVGETLEERESGKEDEVIGRQLSLTKDVPVVAYEPVWAIGTGKTATTEQVAAMHAFIRSLVGPDTKILYGGSVKPDNAKEILSQPNVDGALVGGAALVADSFASIVGSV